jgi:hypothetical protein
MMRLPRQFHSREPVSDISRHTDKPAITAGHLPFDVNFVANVRRDGHPILIG